MTPHLMRLCGGPRRLTFEANVWTVQANENRRQLCGAQATLALIQTRERTIGLLGTAAAYYRLPSLSNCSPLRVESVVVSDTRMC